MKASIIKWQMRQPDSRNNEFATVGFRELTMLMKVSSRRSSEP